MNFMTSIGMVVSALIISLTLTSDKISIDHVPRLDKVMDSQNYTYQFDNEGILNIYLKSSINDQDAYTDLIMLLNKHKNDKNIRIYLAGNGGRVSSASELFYTIKSLPAHVTMIVRGDVYSAHALLALAGDSIEVLNPNILFLYHVPAVEVNKTYITLAESCNGEFGTDRGISKKAKCEDYVRNVTMEMRNTMEKLLVEHILTADQVKDYYAGYDVIITGAQVTKALKLKIVKEDLK